MAVPVVRRLEAVEVAAQDVGEHRRGGREPGCLVVPGLAVGHSGQGVRAADACEEIALGGELLAGGGLADEELGGVGNRPADALAERREAARPVDRVSERQGTQRRVGADRQRQVGGNLDPEDVDVRMAGLVDRWLARFCAGSEVRVDARFEAPLRDRADPDRLGHRLSLTLDADERDLARQRGRGNGRNVPEGVADVLRAVRHEGPQRVHELELVGQELVGRHAFRAVDGGGRQAQDIRVPEVDRPLGPEDDDVAVAHRHGDGVLRVVRAGDLARARAGEPEGHAGIPCAADERAIARDVDDPGPARSAAGPADEAEAGLRLLEDEDILGGGGGIGAAGSPRQRPRLAAADAMDVQGSHRGTDVSAPDDAEN